MVFLENKSDVVIEVNQFRSIKIRLVIYKLFSCSPNIPSGLARR